MFDDIFVHNKPKQIYLDDLLVNKIAFSMLLKHLSLTSSSGALSQNAFIFSSGSSEYCTAMNATAA